MIQLLIVNHVNKNERVNPAIVYCERMDLIFRKRLLGKLVHYI